MKKTTSLKKSDVKKNWLLVDATDQILGRLASKISIILQGKNKPNYAPNLDCGDYVVVINAEKVKVTGDKLKSKIYRKHSGYIGGLKERTLEQLMTKNPAVVLRNAVYRMLPKNRMRDVYISKLKIYAGSEHPHVAQKPELIEIK